MLDEYSEDSHKFSSLCISCLDTVRCKPHMSKTVTSQKITCAPVKQVQFIMYWQALVEAIVCNPFNKTKVLFDVIIDWQKFLNTHSMNSNPKSLF